MTYQPSNPGYATQQPPAGYPPAQQPAGYGVPGVPAVPPGPSKLPVYLTATVAALGLLAFLVGTFAPGRIWSELGAPADMPGESLWMVAAVVAGLLAAVSLLPKVASYAPVIAVVSLLALLLVIAQLVGGGDDISIGWGLWLALLVTLSQAALAVAALLFATGTITPPAPRPGYEQYGQYGPPPAGYYAPAGPPPAGVPGPGYPGPQAQQSGPGGYVPAGYPQSDANLDTPPTGFPSLGQQQSAAPDSSGQSPS